MFIMSSTIARTRSFLVHLIIIVICKLITDLSLTLRQNQFSAKAK